MSPSLLNVASHRPGGTRDSFVLRNNSEVVCLEQGAAGDTRLIAFSTDWKEVKLTRVSRLTSLSLGDRVYALTNARSPQERSNCCLACTRSATEHITAVLEGLWMLSVAIVKISSIIISSKVWTFNQMQVLLELNHRPALLITGQSLSFPALPST